MTSCQNLFRLQCVHFLLSVYSINNSGIMLRHVSKHATY